MIFDDKGILNNISNFSIKSLVQLAGSTPFYVYDISILKRQISKLRNAFNNDPRISYHYAQKANNCTQILQFFESEGLCVDSVSFGEICRALSLGNFTPDRIMFVCDIFSRNALNKVIEQNIYVCCGSIDMISQYGQALIDCNISEKKKIMLRINPGFGHGHHSKVNTGGPQTKHGIYYTSINTALEVAKKYNLTVNGIHLHIGSGSDFEHLSQVSNFLIDFIDNTKLLLPNLEIIDVGGGLPVRYHPSEPNEFDINRYATCWIDALDKIQTEIGHTVKLIVEPGRYLVAESGYFISEIRAIKKNEFNTYYLLDGGFSQFPRPFLYGSYHHISFFLNNPVLNHLKFVEGILGGPLCETGDILNANQFEYGISTKESSNHELIRIPFDTAVGDYAIIHTAGAYCQSMASNYNSIPFSPVILINFDQSNSCKIFSRESLPDLY